VETVVELARLSLVDKLRKVARKRFAQRAETQMFFDVH
jgi:hypothetical protein